MNNTGFKAPDFEKFCSYARAFSQLDERKISVLHSMRPEISHRLAEVNEAFHQHLQSIPKVQSFIADQNAPLKQAHLEWLHQLFNTEFDAAYTQKIYRVGDIYLKNQLPVEFMAGSMSIIQGHLIGLLQEIYAEQPKKLLDALVAINAATGFTLLIMQESYQTLSLDHELERFLAITGMSRALFENLANAYR